MNVNGNFSRKQFVGGLVAAFGGFLLPADAFGTGTPLLKFGLVSDVHLGGEGKDADLEKVLRFFDSQGVDAVMIPGDIAHTGIIKEFERFAAIWYKVFPDDRGADGRKVEKLIVTGNHCIEDWAVPLPAAYGKGFDFKVREGRMVAPEFDPGAKVEVSFCPQGHPEQAKRYAGQPCVAVDFPAAQTPSGVVSEYVVAARLEDGPEIVRTRVLPNGFGLAKARMNIPGTCLFKTRELAGTRPVVFSVTAGECFGKKGRPILSAPFSFDETTALKTSRKLVWGDEFDGTDLDKAKWRFRATMNSDDCLYANDARTYEVKDSKLCLHVRPSPDPTKRCLLPRGVSTHDSDRREARLLAEAAEGHGGTPRLPQRDLQQRGLYAGARLDAGRRRTEARGPADRLRDRLDPPLSARRRRNQVDKWRERRH